MTETLTIDRKQWLAERRKSIGASEAAALFGSHPYISLFSLWESKVNETPIEDEDTEDRRADGLIMEPRIIDKYRKKTGRQVLPSPGLLRNAALPQMSATPDGIAVLETGVQAPLDAKWFENFSKDDDIPIYVQIQIQHQIACMPKYAQAGSLAILGAFRTFHYFDAQRNQAFIDLLMEKVAEFWTKYVIPGIPPNVDGSHATAEAIKRLYPLETGATAELPAESMQWFEEWDRSKVAESEAANRKNEAKNKLSVAIGNATYGLLPNGRILSLKSQTKPECVMSAATFRVLRLIKPKKGKK